MFSKKKFKHAATRIIARAYTLHKIKISLKIHLAC